MTQPVPTKLIELPTPRRPLVMRVLSNPLFHDTGPEPITWTVAQPHPLVPDAKIVRMFSSDIGVEVYSVVNDGKTGMRNFIPMTTVRLVEEVMPIEEFADELFDAEEDDDDEPDEPDDEPEILPEEPAPSNGQVAPS